jgi:hypothetical protein
MADLHLNLDLSRWPNHASQPRARGYSLHARADAHRDQPLDEVLRQLTGFVEPLQNDDLDAAFLRQHVEAFLKEAFESGEDRLSRVYGDDDPLGTEWRLHVEGLTDAEIARRDEAMDELFAGGTRQDALTRMVRLDERLGLVDL